MKRSGVLFIPSANDDPSLPTDKRLKYRAGQGSPLRLCSEDGLLLLQNWRLCPHIFWPFHSAPALPGVDSFTYKLVRDYFLIALVTLVELPMVVCAVPVFLLAPGWIFVAGSIVGYLIVHLLARLTWGTVCEPVSVPTTVFLS